MGERETPLPFPQRNKSRSIVLVLELFSNRKLWYCTIKSNSGNKMGPDFLPLYWQRSVRSVCLLFGLHRSLDWSESVENGKWLFPAPCLRFCWLVSVREAEIGETVGRGQRLPRGHRKRPSRCRGAKKPRSASYWSAGVYWRPVVGTSMCTRVRLSNQRINRCSRFICWSIESRFHAPVSGHNITLAECKKERRFQFGIFKPAPPIQRRDGNWRLCDCTTKTTNYDSSR